MFDTVIFVALSESGSSSEEGGSSKSEKSGSESDSKSTTTNSSPSKANQKHTKVTFIRFYIDMPEYITVFKPLVGRLDL